MQLTAVLFGVDRDGRLVMLPPSTCDTTVPGIQVNRIPKENFEYHTYQVCRKKGGKQKEGWKERRNSGQKLSSTQLIVPRDNFSFFETPGTNDIHSQQDPHTGGNIQYVPGTVQAQHTYQVLLCQKTAAHTKFQKTKEPVASVRSPHGPVHLLSNHRRPAPPIFVIVKRVKRYLLSLIHI